MSQALLDAVLGQAPAVETLKNAIAGQRVHHAYRFEGPAGVGKERTALAFAAALLCEQGGCGDCSTCHRVTTFSDEQPRVPLHPDVVLIGRQLYPQTMVAKREASGISVEQIRKVVLARAGYPPHEGRALVFIVRDAEELTPSAANALLKTLEEPGPAVHFVLLSSRPRKLLDTVRSRTLAVRFRALPDALVARILESLDKDPTLAPLGQGSAGAALELAEAEQADSLALFAEGVEKALQDPTLSTALSFSGSAPNDRSELRTRLLAYGQQLAGEVRELMRSDVAPTDVAPTDVGRAERLAKHYAVLQKALVALEANTTPALALDAMLIEMRMTE